MLRLPIGEQIRCVVSISMLTAGWDTNTVTHILGVRTFGTQLLCEQVVGRGLRRQSYELNEEGLFDVEYADIMGIPFDFAASPQVAKPTVPKPVTRVHAIKERSELEIVFPRVSGYLIAAISTMARPDAILDMSVDDARAQWYPDAAVFNLNPAGRLQTRKRRPFLPVPPNADELARGHR